MRFSATKSFFVTFLLAFNVQGRAVHLQEGHHDSDDLNDGSVHADTTPNLHARAATGIFLPEGFPNPTVAQMDKYMTAVPKHNPFQDVFQPPTVTNVKAFPALKGTSLGTERVNTAIYKPLGVDAFKLGMLNLKGCTSLVIVSNTAVYMTHYWEGSFNLADQDLVNTGFRLSQGFQKLVLSGITGSPAAVPYQDALAPNAASFKTPESRGFLIHPNKADEPASQPGYDAGIIKIKDAVKKILPTLNLQVVNYDPLGDVPDAELAKLPNDAAREKAKVDAEKAANKIWDTRAFGNVMFTYGGSGVAGAVPTADSKYKPASGFTVGNKYLFVEHREVYPTLKPFVVVRP